jgi:hypothetical protein
VHLATSNATTNGLLTVKHARRLVFASWGPRKFEVFRDPFLQCGILAKGDREQHDGLRQTRCKI